MSKITLNNVGSLLDYTTAQAAINDNFEIIQDAMDTTLSRDGTAPNTINATVDMNSHQIINLPSPGSNYSPLRLIDAASLNGGGTIAVSPLPTGGTAGQVLTKDTSADFNTSWQTPAGSLPTGGSTGQFLKKNSTTDYDTSWTSISTTVGGSTNNIQYNTGSAFGGIALSQGQVLTGTTAVPTGAYPSMVNVVSAFSIDNTGVSNVASALQTAINTITTASDIVYIPSGTYNLGSSSLNIPSYSTIVCHPNATLLRTSDPTYTDYTNAMVYWTGTGVNWYGGILSNTTVLATSTTSNTINGSNKTWTTQAGLPITAGSTFLRVWSASHPEAHFEGTASAYAGTTLTINSPFNGGSGTYTDWNIGIGHIYQTAMCLHGATKSVVEGLRVTGNWYVGLMMDGWNPPAGGPLNCRFNIWRGCSVEGVQNRGIYYYGTCWDNVMDDCFVSGVNLFAGCTDYCYNFNPANASGSINSQLRNKTIGCLADSAGFQGFGVADQTSYMILSDCSATNISNAAGNGFAVFYANGLSPQYIKIHNSIASNCGAAGFANLGALFNQFTGCMAVANQNGFQIGPSTAQSQYVIMCDCLASTNTSSGFLVQGNSARCNLSDVQAISNTSFGINIGSGSNVIIANGRCNSNGTNFADSGTGTVSGITTA